MVLIISSIGTSQSVSGEYQEITAVGKEAGKSIKINFTSFDSSLPLRKGDKLKITLRTADSELA